MLQEYEVYFTFWGKKMKAKVLANGIEHAKEQVSDKLYFHKVKVAGESSLDDAIDELKEMMENIKALREFVEKFDSPKNRH